MTGLNTEFAVDGMKIYYSPTVITDKTEDTLKAAATDSARIKNVSSMGDIASVRNNITYSNIGDDYSSSTPGLADPGTFDFSLNWIPTDSIHQIFSADNGKVLHTFIVTIDAGDELTYVAFDGRVGSASQSGDAGSIRQLAVSIYRVKGHKTVNAA